MTALLEELFYAFIENGVDVVGSDFNQHFKYEQSVVHSRVRNCEFRSVYLIVSEKNHVAVKRS